MMRTDKWTKGALLGLVAGLSTACGTQPVVDDVATSSEEITITTTIPAGNILFTPQWPFAFEGCGVSAMFNVAATSNLAFLGVDVADVSDLSLSLFSLGADGALLPITGISPTRIDAALLANVRALLPAWMIGIPLLSTAQLDLLAARLDPSAQTALLGLLPAGTGLTGTAALSAALGLALNPWVTDSTMIFWGLDSLAMTNVVLRASFSSQAAFSASMGLIGATSLGLVQSGFFSVPFGAACIAPTLSTWVSTMPALTP